jgi:kynurenine formamidase
MTHEAARQAITAARERIGSAELLAALTLPREGRVFDLATQLANDMPVGPEETFAGFRLTQYRTPKCIADRENLLGFDFSMELLSGSPHLGTHLDALAHIAAGGKHFGGVSVHDAYDDFGWKQNGIETVPPIVGRGILLDAARAEGVDKLPDGFEIGTELIQRCLAEQGTELRRGDTVLVRTGKFLDYHGEGPLYFDAQPGIGVAAAVWLYDQGMAVLGTDTSATEVFPFRDLDNTVHKAMLVERGVYLVEILDLEELAAARAYEFLFVCLPLKIRGGTGSWVRPLALV